MKLSCCMVTLLVLIAAGATSSRSQVIVDGPFEMRPDNPGWYGGEYDDCPAPGWPDELLAVASHDGDPVSAEAATRFVPGTCPILELGWVAWEIGTAFGHPIYWWTVRFYADADGVPGTEIWRWRVPDGDSAAFGQCAGLRLPEPLTFHAERPYWVSVTPDLRGFQWGIGAVPDASQPAVFRSEASAIPTGFDSRRSSTARHAERR